VSAEAANKYRAHISILQCGDNGPLGSSRFVDTSMTSPPSVALTGDRNFMKLWAAQAVSSVGARITREGLPMTAVLALGASPAVLGVLAALSYGPALVVGLAGGGFVDGRRRRTILIGADLIRAAVLITVPIAAWLGWLSIWQVFTAAVVVGAASVLFDMADHAYLPALIGTDRLVDGNSKLSATESVAELAGPALAGLLFQVLSAPFAIAVNAGTYLVSAMCLTSIDRVEPRPATTPPEHWLKGITHGVRLALADARIRPLLIMAACNGLFGGAFAALYLVFVLKTLGLTPLMLGLTVAFGGLGSLAGAGVAGRLASRLGAGPTIIAAAFLAAAMALLIPLAPAQPVVVGMVMLILAQLFGDASATIYSILAASLRQTVLPPEALGRVAGAFSAAQGGTVLVGALLAGVAAEVFGVREVLLLAAVGLTVGPLLAVSSSALRQVSAIQVSEG
jgi:predicted MFS family arabinose efflux permease